MGHAAPADSHSKALVALHWLMALLIGALLVVGFVMTDADPDGATRLWLSRAHLGLGLTTGLALVARLIVKVRSPPVAPLETSAPERVLRQVVHAAIYLVLFAILASGLATSFLGDWPSYVVLGTTTSAPDLHAIPPREGHETFAFALIGLVGLHVVGVALHEARVGGALRRMLPSRT